MKRHILKHNMYHHDAYANQSLEPLKSGYSRGVSSDQPGSAYTRCFPQLKADDSKVANKPVIHEK